MKAEVLPLTGFKGLDLKQAGYQKLMTSQDMSRRDRARKFQQCFSTETGKEVLAIMTEWTLVRPVSPPGCQAGYSYFREGQNDIVRSIHEAIEEATHE